MAASNLFKNKEYNVVSCYSMGGKRIFYHEIFENPPDDLAEALLRIAPKIDMDKIRGIVDSTPAISETRREYLKRAIEMRYEQIILPSLTRVLQSEKDKTPSQNIARKASPKTKPTHI